MAWFARFTRFGQAHMCYAQEQSDSCGIASSIMVNFKLKSGSIGLSSYAKALFPSQGEIIGKLLGQDAPNTALKAEAEVYKMVSKTYDGKVGTTGDQVEKVLNKLKIGRWKGYDRYDTSKIGAEIIAAYRNGWPTIIGNSWYKDSGHSKLAGGGHWVVVDGINKWNGTLYASICDPITGNVHITPFEVGKPFVYDPTNPIGFNVGVDDYKHYGDGYKKKGYSLMDGLVKCVSSKLKTQGLGGMFAL